MTFRQIHTQIWKDDYFLDLTPEEKLLFIYLFSNESTSLSGLYKIPLRVICFETGLDQNFVIDTLKKYEQAGKVVYESGVIWVVNMRKYHETRSPKIKIAIANDLNRIPDCPIKQRYLSGNIPYVYPIHTDAYQIRSDKIRVDGDVDNTEQPIPYIQPAPTTTSSAFHYGNSPFGSHTPQLCEKLYKLTTGQPSIPNDILGRALPDLETILDHYQQDPAKAAPVGQQVFARWCSTTGKSGRRYSTTNPGWLTWWLEELAPRPLDREQDPGKMSDADYLAYKLAQAKELGIT